MQNENTDPTGRQQDATVLLDAPIELVWDVWTNPEHVIKWWGPNGVINTIINMDVKTGGDWTFSMHGPDGRIYPNKIVFRDVDKYKRIVQEHFGPNFISDITFQPQGNKTIMHWHKLYETKGLYEMMQKYYKADEGFTKTIEKLNDYLHQLIPPR